VRPVLATVLIFAACAAWVAPADAHPGQPSRGGRVRETAPRAGLLPAPTAARAHAGPLAWWLAGSALAAAIVLCRRRGRRAARLSPGPAAGLAGAFALALILASPHLVHHVFDPDRGTSCPALHAAGHAAGLTPEPALPIATKARGAIDLESPSPERSPACEAPQGRAPPNGATHLRKTHGPIFPLT